jgi:hypothetical protein
MSSQVEKYILVRGMHLGNIKDTFGAGAVIEYNSANQAVRIDGRICENGAKDVEILKRQAIKAGHEGKQPWIVQYSEEALRDIRGESQEAIPVVPKAVPNHMPVIQSDEDSHQVIDISHTQVSKIKQAEVEAERARKASGEMPVVQGGQSVEDRIAELKDAKNTNLSARAERVRLMTSKKADMPIVRDDSLGAAHGSSASAMNAGSIVGGRRPNEVPEHVSQSAQARKQEVQSNRQRMASDEHGFDTDQAGIDEITPHPDEVVTSTAEAAESVAPAMNSQDEKAALMARLAEIEAQEAAAEAETPKRPTVVRTPVKEQ